MRFFSTLLQPAKQRLNLTPKQADFLINVVSASVPFSIIVCTLFKAPPADVGEAYSAAISK